ncbi:YkgJ family cysteine cluster protein [Aliarcobacter butzleri]|uniref:YkgJ family cysteine cluster protein n=1 Tax=Aliarcobacter butzleri TaxID=28197 RepID=UPI0021B23C8D|nr:YkgJ family cysteine cluster protein [Aliarcobacter butzleri]MCT7576281.1 YkgJ family cysteine cluster protein [Aliarcobacter butzleri]
MFPCTSCGVCCQNISHITELKDFDLGDGICKYFNKQSMTCKIYDIRPDVCRVDLMFEKEYYKYYDKEEFYRLNVQVCNKLQEKFNLDKKYRINIGE